MHQVMSAIDHHLCTTFWIPLYSFPSRHKLYTLAFQDIAWDSIRVHTAGLFSSQATIWFSVKHTQSEESSKSICPYASQIFNTLNGVFNLYHHSFLTDSMEIFYETRSIHVRKSYNQTGFARWSFMICTHYQECMVVTENGCKTKIAALW